MLVHPIYCRLVLFDSVWHRTVWHAQSLLAGRTIIDVKMQTIVGILTFMSRINMLLSWVENDLTLTSDLLAKPFCKLHEDKYSMKVKEKMFF